MPLSLHFGVPLYDLQLCKAVCQRAVSEEVLGPGSLQSHVQGLAVLHARLNEFMWTHSSYKISEDTNTKPSELSWDGSCQEAEADKGAMSAGEEKVLLPGRNMWCTFEEGLSRHC